MKKTVSIYKNWRVIILGLLAMTALFILAGETDNTVSLLITKGIGFGLAYIIYRLGKYWNGKGKINELIELADKD